MGDGDGVMLLKHDSISTHSIDDFPKATNPKSYKNKMLFLTVVMLIGVSIILLASSKIDSHRIEEQKIHLKNKDQEKPINVRKNARDTGKMLQTENEAKVVPDELQDKLKSWKQLSYAKRVENYKRMMKFGQTRKIFQQMKCLQEVPDKLTDKWIPLPSRFIGVEEYLHKTKQNGTVQEKLLYESQPFFEKLKKNGQLIRMVMNYLEGYKLTGTCEFTAEKHKTKVVLENGSLIINQTFVEGINVYPISRVYYIPNHEVGFE